MNDRIKILKNRVTILLISCLTSMAFGQENPIIDSLLSEIEVADEVTKMVLYRKVANQYNRIDTEKALEYINKSYEIAQARKDDLNIGEALNSRGVIYDAGGESSKATDDYLKALRIFERLEMPDKQSAVYCNLGVVYNEMKRYDQALKYHKKAYELDLTLGNPHFIISDLTNIANVLQESGVVNDSIFKYYNEALDLADANELIYYKSIIYDNMGSLYMRADKLDSALYYYNESFTIKDILGDHQAMTYTLINLGTLYTKLGKNDLAISKLEKALELSKEQKNKRLIFESLSGIRDHYASIGNFKKAFIYQSQADSTQETILSETQVKEIENLRAKYEMEKKEQEIENLQAKSALQTMIKNISMVLVVLLIILLALVYNRYRLRAKLAKDRELHERERSKLLKRQLDSKNRELTSYAVNALERNNILERLSEEIDELAVKVPEVKSIKRSLKSSMDLSEDWNTLKIHFEEVHPNFFAELKKIGPQLSQNDLKHCAYMKINLSQKEIARMINVDTNSVKVARYRIKKKLGLSAEQSLQSFINSITTV